MTAPSYVTARALSSSPSEATRGDLREGAETRCASRSSRCRCSAPAGGRWACGRRWWRTQSRQLLFGEDVRLHRRRLGRRIARMQLECGVDLLLRTLGEGQQITVHRIAALERITVVAGAHYWHGWLS